MFSYQYHAQKSRGFTRLSTNTFLSITDVPSPPLGPLGFYGIDKDSLTITWYPSEKNGGSPILDYSVESRREGAEWRLAATVSNTYADLRDLTTSEVYMFRICARNEIGTSLPYISDEKITIGKTLCECSL